MEHQPKADRRNTEQGPWNSPKKIMIIGCGGSGKSTLARKIHQITGLPLIHMDQYFWAPNWEEPDREVWTQTVSTQSDQLAWIMDGNYGGTMDIRFQKADLIIFLDRSRWLCLFRIIWRQLKYYGRTRPDMTEGCTERLTWEFVKYVYGYNDTRRPGILEKLHTFKGSKKVLILSNRKQIKQCLQKMT